MPTNHIKRSIEDPFGRLQSVLVNLGESPLSWLHARGHVSDRQFRAGELIRSDWEKAGLAPRVTMRWDPMPSGGQGGRGAPDPSARQMGARERFEGALRATGPGLSDIVWRVVCAGEGLAAAERALHWPGRAGKLVLTLALDRVADWYRVA